SIGPARRHGRSRGRPAWPTSARRPARRPSGATSRPPAASGAGWPRSPARGPARPSGSSTPSRPPDARPGRMPTGQARFPVLYEINTRIWLGELSRELGRAANLDHVPDAALNRLAGLGVAWVWMLGVWRTGAAGRRVSRTLT